MKANNEKRKEVLHSLLKEITEKSKVVSSYSIETSEEDDNLYVKVLLINEKDIVVWKDEGEYFDVYCNCQLFLFPLI